MRINVIIPTYHNESNSLLKTLAAIANQSYKKFGVLIVYKNWSGWRKQRKQIEGIPYPFTIRFIEQDTGRFEEALNTAYQISNADINIHTDDDATPTIDWVKDHVQYHQQHKNVGLLGGVVEETYPKNYSLLQIFLDKQKWRLNKHTIIDAPLEPHFQNYGMYIGKSGMLVDTGRQWDGIPTLKQIGVNMSWKRHALKGFKLSCYTKSGYRNEAAAALEAIQRGFTANWFNGGRVLHPKENSLTRGTSIASIPIELTIENVLFSYYIQTQYLNNVSNPRHGNASINMNALRLRTRLDSIIASFMTKGQNTGSSLGFQITEQAIKEDWAPKQVRNEIFAQVGLWQDANRDKRR